MGYCSHLTKPCPFYMGADNYYLVFCSHSSFLICWKLSGKTTKFLDQKKKIIHGHRISGGMRVDGKLGIMWLLLSKDIEISLPREGSFCFFFLHGRNEPWHLLVGFICSGSVYVSCVLPQAPFTVNKDRRFQGALFLTYFRYLF